MKHYSLISFGIYVALSLGVISWVYYDAFEAALSNDRIAGEVRLSEASSRLRGQLGVYRALANITAKTPKTALALNPKLSVKIDDDLSLLNLTYGAWDIGLTTPQGQVIASSSVHHSNYVYSQYLVRAAMNGRLGYAIEIENGQRLIRFSRGVIGKNSKTIGAILVSANLAALEFEWPLTPEPLIFFNTEGLSISANRPELLLLTNRRDSKEANHLLDNPRKTAGTVLWTFSPAKAGLREVQVLNADIPQLQMTAQIILDTNAARSSALLRAVLAATFMAAIGLVGAVFVQQRRRLASEARHSVTLEQRVEERTGELKAAQNELVESSNLAALGRLSAGISHELNQPLSAILNFAENGRRLIARNRTSDAAENLSKIAEQIRRITRIISNLRAFARQEHRPSECIELSEIVEKVLELTQSEIKSGGITLNTDMPDYPIPVMAGKVRLEQVVLNLVSNSIDAMLNCEQKILCIKLKELNGQAILSIKDTGCGIKDPERVFEPFYTTKELGSSKGLGMGLALSFGLVARFNGQLSCQNLTQGAQFTMTLPILAEKQ